MIPNDGVVSSKQPNRHDSNPQPPPPGCKDIFTLQIIEPVHINRFEKSSLAVTTERTIRYHDLQLTMQNDTSSMIVTTNNNNIKREYSTICRRTCARERDYSLMLFQRREERNQKRQDARRARRSQALVTFWVHGQEVANISRSVLERLLRAPAQFSVCSPGLCHRGTDVTFPSADGSHGHRFA